MVWEQKPIVERTQTKGRKTRCTAKLTAKVCNAIKWGMIPWRAASMYGIAQQTFFEWMRRGRGDDDRPRIRQYAQFAAAVTAAEAESQGRLADVIMRAALGDPKNKVPGDPQLALAWMKTRFAKDHAVVEKHEISGPDGKPLPPTNVATTIVVLPKEAWEDDDG